MAPTACPIRRVAKGALPGVSFCRICSKMGSNSVMRKWAVSKTELRFFSFERSMILERTGVGDEKGGVGDEEGMRRGGGGKLKKRSK